MKYVKIVNQTQPRAESIRAKYCQSFFCQLRGLMFTSRLPENDGLLLVQNSDSRINASIHMMFMCMDLAIIWIDSEYSVVDKVLARRWNPVYIPKKAAKYVLETVVTNLGDFNIGDKLRIEEISQDLDE
jgi:uncharacterized membrane protein (UPF0127 family)